MKYLPFFLLCFLVLTSPETQSASSTSNPILTSKTVVYASDSLIVNDPKKQKRARVVWVLAAGTALTIGGIVLGIPQMIIIGGIVIIVALLSARKKPAKTPPNTQQTKPSDSSRKGIASPGCALLIVGAGIAAVALFFYTILNYGQS